MCIGIDFGTTNSVCSVKMGDLVKSIFDKDGKCICLVYDLFKKMKLTQVLVITLNKHEFIW